MPIIMFLLISAALADVTAQVAWRHHAGIEVDKALRAYDRDTLAPRATSRHEQLAA